MGKGVATQSKGMSHRWLVLRLEAPMMAFGGIAVDQVRPVRDFPATSMMAGLVGNAMGWHWRDGVRHQTLQDRMIIAGYCANEGALLTDTQNVELAKNDRAWTTRGQAVGRAGDSYKAPHRRVRDYHADRAVRIVLRLDPADQPPPLAQVADAFDCPARPLFIGRKPCLPSRPFLAPEPERWVEAPNAYAALCAVASREQAGSPLQALWPAGEGPEGGDNVDCVVERADLRNWVAGVHSGSRNVVEGWVT